MEPFESLDGPQLADHVATALGWKLAVGVGDADGLGTWFDEFGPVMDRQSWQPQKDWSQGGPLVAESWIAITAQLETLHGPGWRVAMAMEPGAVLCHLMRAFVAVKLGGLPA